MSDRQALGSKSDEVMLGDTAPNYSGIDIPATKPRDEFTVEERRAELLEIITQVGHPSRVNQTELAERYGVTQPMIYKDLDALSEHVRDRLGDRHELEIESVFRRSIKGLLDEEEWRKAAQTAKDYSDWLSERGEIEDLRKEVDMLKTATGFDK